MRTDVTADATPPLRVLQVIETGGPGGAETILVELSDGLQRRGHHVSAVVGGEGWLAQTLRERGVKVECHRSFRAFDTELLHLLIGRIRSERIDVVHAHLFGGALYAGLAAWFCGIPAIVTLHGLTDVRDAGLRMTLKRRILRWTAGRIVVVSESLRGEISAALHTSLNRLVVIPNGVRSADGVLAPVRNRAERALASDWRPTLVAVGNIRAPKGYPVLVQAVALVAKRFPQVRLRVAGQSDGGKLMEELDATVKRLGIEKNVEFLGFVSDPTTLLTDADCFVLASLSEGFSLATIEAMLAGTPVIATRSGGPEEILTDEQTGLLVPPSDPAALAAAIERTLLDPTEAFERAQRAQREARERYSLDTMVATYEATYRELRTHRN